MASTGPSADPNDLEFPEGFPRVFGKYVLLQTMARGGMGELFLAAAGEVEGFEKLCVVKRVIAELEDEGIHRRFMDEAKVVVRLNHANLVQVFDAGKVGREYYLAMELVEGKDLRAVWNRCAKLHRRIPVDVAIFTIREVLRGLAYAHDVMGLDLVHRDISPPNILLSYHGDVKLTDFGLAKSAIKRETTNPGVVFGRYSYLSPEQARGLPADRRTDIYAAGIVLWELLTGRQLFPSHSVGHREALAKVRNPKVRPPSDVVPGVPDGLDGVVLRALAPDRDQRYLHANEFRAALSDVLAREFPGCDRDRVSEFMREIFALERRQERRTYERYARQDFRAYREAAGQEDVVSISDTIQLDPEDEDLIFVRDEDDAPVSSPGSGGLRSTARRLVGTVLDGKYRIERLLGVGGMGAVFRAEHVGIGRTCAVKVLHRRYTQDPDIVARFEREARAATQTGHPNIVDVWDIGTTATGETYFVMELLEGETLGELLRREAPLPVERAVHIVGQISRAVAAAHDVGIIHRDLKSDNVFLVARGKDMDFVKVLDFGVCKSAEDGVQTAPGLVMGSPDYMAPEQAAGRPATASSDVYAIGCILFEALTGRLPYEGRNPVEVLIRKGAEDAPGVCSLRPEVPEAVAAVVARCLRRVPDARFPSARVLEYELARAVSGRPAAVAKVLGLPDAAPSPPSPDTSPVALGEGPAEEATETGGVEDAPARPWAGAIVGRALLFVALGSLLGAAIVVAHDPTLIDVLLGRSEVPPASSDPGPLRSFGAPEPRARPPSARSFRVPAESPTPRNLEPNHLVTGVASPGRPVGDPAEADGVPSPEAPRQARVPPSVDALVDQARAALAEGRYRTSDGSGLALLLARVGLMEPGHPEIGRMRGAAVAKLWPKAEPLVDRRRWEEALPVLRDLVAVAPDHEAGRAALAKALRGLGRRRKAAGKLDEAAELAAEWVNVAPGDPSARAWLGEVELARGNYARAEEALAAALKARPRSRRTRRLLRRARILGRRAAARRRSGGRNRATEPGGRTGG